MGEPQKKIVEDLSPSLEALQSWLVHNSQYLNLTDEQQCSILFIVRLCDSLHACGNATFLTDSWIEELKMQFQVPLLCAEFDTGAIRWSYVSFYAIHRVAADMDCDAMQDWSKIASGAADGSISAAKGHELLQNLEIEQDQDTYGGFKWFCKSNWGLYVTYPLGGAFYGLVIFGATAIDAAFGLVAGILTALILHFTILFPQFQAIAELLISIAVSMVALAAYTFFPDASCYTEQTLGSITNFLYGIAYVISLYEMTASNSLLLTGVTRFASAILKTYILAAGVVIGCWFGVYAGGDRVESILNQDCSELDTQPAEHWRLLCAPGAFFAILLVMQISPRYWLICMAPQAFAFYSQYALDKVLEQPVLVVNLAPAYIATVASYFCIAVAHRLKITDLKVSTSAYLNRSVVHRDDTRSERPGISRRMGQRNIRTSVVEPVPGACGRMLHYQRSDLWFCLLPSLFLLVPGGSVWRVAFFSVLDATWNADYESAANSIGELISGIMVIGISQVIGVRLGFATISLYATFKQLWSPEKLFTNEEA